MPSRLTSWKDSTSAHSTGSTTITITTITVGDTSVTPARESRWARTPRARRFAGAPARV